MKLAILLLLAFLIDIVIGDPKAVPHPVVYIGRWITRLETMARKWAVTDQQLKMAGVMVVISIVAGTYAIFSAIIWVSFLIHTYVGWLVSVVIMSQSLALHSLYKHAQAVARPLVRGDVVSARRALAMIVGRDTEHLQEQDITRGVVETISENTVDGITAPIFYGMIGGPALAMAYKAVNTLDSMVGYKNQRYFHFGWAGAKLDDVANYIPARLTGGLYVLLAPFTKGGLQKVWQTIKEDAPKHLSPNSGIPEAAVAGALEIQLGGTTYYKGVPSNRALLGKAVVPIETRHIQQSLYIMVVVSILFLLMSMVGAIAIERGFLH